MTDDERIIREFIEIGFHMREDSEEAILQQYLRLLKNGYFLQKYNKFRQIALDFLAVDYKKKRLGEIVVIAMEFYRSFCDDEEAINWIINFIDTCDKYIYNYLNN